MDSIFEVLNNCCKQRFPLDEILQITHLFRTSILEEEHQAT